MLDLQYLQAASSAALCLPPELQAIHSPLYDHFQAWQAALEAHHDVQFVGYILDGIRYGFRIGFSRRQHLVPAIRNAPSAMEHPEVVEQYLTDEISAGRMIGPFSESDIPGCQISRMGVIPKGHTPGQWRLITDLSFPPGASVNDGIDPEVCSLQYTSVEKVARVAQRLGKGTLCWPKWTYKLRIALFRSTQAIAHCWGSSGGMLAISTGCSHLACVLLRRFLQLWQMR